MAQSSLAEKVELAPEPVASWEIVVTSATSTSISDKYARVTLVCTARGVKMVEEQNGSNAAEAALSAICLLVPAGVFVERPVVQIVGRRVEAHLIASRGNVCVIGTSRNPDPALAVAKAYLHALLQLDKGPK
ncbi:MAG: hypothetical protein V4474_01415 [Patescibacteria group bacterium]